MPLKLRRRGGYYHARGTVWWRSPAGGLTRIRIEESTRTGTFRDAQRIAREIERSYFEQAFGDRTKPGETFAEAALTYMQTTGVTRFMDPLLAHFGTTPLSAVDQAAATQACEMLYPDATPATWNRQVFTPMIAIKGLAARQGKNIGPKLERPKGHDALPELDIPTDEWFDAVLPHCNRRTAALILTLSMRGRRIGELVAIRSADVDRRTQNVRIGRTKTGRPVLLHIPDEAFAVMDDWRTRELFFGYKTRFTANQAIARACVRAGVKVYSSHAIGRHKFALRVLQEGHSLKFLRDAGGWESIAMPARRYGHLERSEVDETVKELGTSWARTRATTRGEPGEKRGNAPKPKRKDSAD